LFVIHHDRIQHAAYYLQCFSRRNKNARRHAFVDGELGRVFRRNQQSALLHEFLQMSHASFAQTGACIFGRVQLSQIRSKRGVQPGQCISPHRQGADNLLRRCACYGRENNYVEFRAQVRLFRYRLRADIRKWDAKLIEGQAPPAFGLRVKPGVHERNAGSRRGMNLHRWLDSDAHRDEIELL